MGLLLVLSLACCAVFWLFLSMVKQDQPLAEWLYRGAMLRVFPDYVTLAGVKLWRSLLPEHLRHELARHGYF